MVLSTAFSCIDPAFVQPEPEAEDEFYDAAPSARRLAGTRSEPIPRGVRV